MTPTEDLDRLLSASTDGELSDDDRLHLAVLLRDDSAARAAYLDYMLLDSLLRWEKPQPLSVIPAPPARPTPIRSGRTFRPAGWALVASLLVGIGVGLLLTVPTREVAAKSDIVDRLADWNLAIAEASGPGERFERFHEQDAAMTAELARSELRPDERELAVTLYNRVQALSTADDLVAVAEQLDATAENMHSWLDTHSNIDPGRAAAVERHYLRFVERSMSKVSRAAANGPDKGRRARLEKLTERAARRAENRAQKETERQAKKAGR